MRDSATSEHDGTASRDGRCLWAWHSGPGLVRGPYDAQAPCFVSVDNCRRTLAKITFWQHRAETGTEVLTPDPPAVRRIAQASRKHVDSWVRLLGQSALDLR